MVHEPVLECAFFIPTHRDANLSDGQLHEQRAWNWLHNELFVRFEGATTDPGLYEGYYKDPDTDEPVSDKSHMLIVAVPKAHLDDLRQLLSAACVLFQQKCIYLSVAGEVEFIEAPEHDSS